MDLLPQVLKVPLNGNGTSNKGLMPKRKVFQASLPIPWHGFTKSPFKFPAES